MGTRPARAVSRRLVLGLALPLVAFVVLQQEIGDATAALAITDAIPLLWILAIAIWRRRLEWIGVIPFAVYALALALTITFGGSSLPLELRRAVFPGLIGLGCLLSIAMRRPALAMAAEQRMRRDRDEGASRPAAPTPGAHRALAIVTAIIGVTCLADAVAQVVLALTVSTTTFGVVARIASYAIIGSGIAVCALYVRHVRARLRRRAESGTEVASERPPPP